MKQTKNQTNTRNQILAVTAAFLLALTGCGANSSSSETTSKDSDSNANSTAEVSDSTAEASGNIEQESIMPEQASFQLTPYAMKDLGCAVEIPDTFTEDSSSSAVSGRLSFDGTESDDMIMVTAEDESEFSNFDENDLFEIINFSTTLPQLQYFREAEIKNMEGVSCKAYVGETLGTINGEDTYVTILAANCPSQDKMFVFAMRDKTGEYQTYRNKMEDYIYLNETGYVVENDKLVDAPEPEPLSYANDTLGYQIDLPKEWELVTDTSGFYGLESMTPQYDGYDLFMNRNRDYAIVAAKSMDVADAVFYSSVDQYKSSWTGAGGNELVSSKECTVYGYAAYQLVINHTAGADPTTSVTWLINKTGNDSKLFLVRYYYRDDSAAEFADTFINSIHLNGESVETG